MNAKYNIILQFVPIIVICIVCVSCDNPTNGDPVYKGMIKGWVYDDSTKIPVNGVKVWADGIPDTLNTDLSGMFHYTKIDMPRGEFIYNLVFQRFEYADKSYSVYVKSDVETTIDSVFLIRTH
jgi:hypothetical protein